MRNVLYVFAYIIFMVLLISFIRFPGDNLSKPDGRHGFIHIFTTVVTCFVVPIVWLVWVFEGFDEDARNDEWYNLNNKKTPLNMFGKFKLGWAIFLLLLVYFGYNTYSKSVTVYNTSK